MCYLVGALACPGLEIQPEPGVLAGARSPLPAAGGLEAVGLSSNMPDDLWSLLPLGKCFCFPHGVHSENNPKETSTALPLP